MIPNQFYFNIYVILSIS